MNRLPALEDSNPAPGMEKVRAPYLILSEERIDSFPPLRAPHKHSGRINCASRSSKPTIVNGDLGSWEVVSAGVGGL